MPSLLRGGIAEFIGTFALVFFGCGSIVLTHGDVGAGSLVTVAMAHGLALVVFVTACMYVSGAQFNPAVSIGLLLLGKQGPKEAAAYIVAQLLASACGVGMLVLLVGQDPGLKTSIEAVSHGATLGSLSVGEHASVFAVFGIEAIMTFALMFVILAAVVDGRAHKLGGFCVGLTVAMCIVGFGPLTGASMNPARSFGPAVYGHWEMHWVYWVAPIVGACAAALVYKVVWGEPAGEAG